MNSPAPLRSAFRGLLLFGALALGACGVQALEVPVATVPTLQASGLARPVLTVTDLDTVRGVVESPEGLWVGTDRGLLLYRSEDAGRPRRFARELPSEDVRGLLVMPSGELMAYTPAGGAMLRGETVVPGEQPLPPVGELVDVHVAGNTAWACGTTGAARWAGTGWERFGEAFTCTGLFSAAGNRVWIGTTRGLLYVDEGDVIREHGEGRGLPAGYVRAALDDGEGKVFALVQGNANANLAYFDGQRWYEYTLPGFEESLIGLARLAGEPVMITRTAAFAIQSAEIEGATGVPLVLLERGERGRVLGYQARLGGSAPASEAAAPAPPRALAPLPENLPTVRGPGFYARPLGIIGSNVYGVHPVGEALYVADRNNGIRALGQDGPGRELRSRDMVAARDLQVAVDASGATWLINDDGVIAKWDEDAKGLVRVPVPSGLRPWAIASGDEGLYVAATRTSAPGTVVIFRRNRNQWAPALQRQLTLGEGEELAGVPMMAVASAREVWVAVRIRGTTPGSGRLRGVAVLRPDEEPITYHRRGATPETDGPGAMSIPDDFSNLDLGDPPRAWLSTISGAVRIDESQAITFGEARGVRGEVVSDVLVGTEGKVWMAAAEGPGYYYNREFEFRMPENVKAARPLALALDRSGRVWGAGGNGLVLWSEGSWSVYGEGSGLPSTSFGDIEVDARDRLWLLTPEEVLIVLPGVAPAAPAE
ncbi:MAG: hypothetical protein AAGH15_07020 [Myxococcota bacterium]